MIAALLLLGLGCGEPHQAVERAMAPPAGDPAQVLAGCPELAFEELRVLCRVEAAAEAGRQARPEVAEEACTGLEPGTWAHECHFRAGEELARGGLPVEAVGHCARAGRFARFCITHAGWAMPPRPELQASLGAEAVVPAMEQQLTAIEEAVLQLEEQARLEALDTFRMALWFNVYYGSGQADPTAARAASPDHGAQARTAWAVEASRLLAPSGTALPDAPLERLQAIWDGREPAPTGAPLTPHERHGRYNVPLPVPCERELEPVPLFGGGRRIRGVDAAEDLVVAGLEALYFQPATPAETFLPWVEDPRERVRWTAARLLRVSEPDALDMEATLASLSEHDDPCVAWNARDGLEHRTWVRKPGGPR